MSQEKLKIAKIAVKKPRLLIKRKSDCTNINRKRKGIKSNKANIKFWVRTHKTINKINFITPPI